MIHLQALGEFIVNYPLALLLCIVAYMIIGSVWYGPLFSKSWARMHGIDMNNAKKKEDMMKAMVPAMLTSVATGFVIAVVLGRGLEILAVQDWTHPLIIATILWLPFTALPIAQNYAYLQKPFKLVLIDAGYMLAGTWAMSLILYAMI